MHLTRHLVLPPFIAGYTRRLIYSCSASSVCSSYYNMNVFSGGSMFWLAVPGPEMFFMWTPNIFN